MRTASGDCVLFCSPRVPHCASPALSHCACLPSLTECIVSLSLSLSHFFPRRDDGRRKGVSGEDAQHHVGAVAGGKLGVLGWGKNLP